MANLGHTLGDMLADVATKATNRALHTDPQLRARLQALTGNTVEINCTMPPLDWHLTVIDGGLQLAQGRAHSPQVIVQGSAVDLAAWIFPGQAAGRINIEGDETLLLEVVDILRGFQPDIQDPLGEFLGPQLAQTILGTAELGLQGLRSMLEGVGKAAQGSGPGRVQQEQLNTVLDGIDELRLRVDRLAAQVNESQGRSPGSTSSGDG